MLDRIMPNGDAKEPLGCCDGDASAGDGCGWKRPKGLDIPAVAASSMARFSLPPGPMPLACCAFA